MAVATGRLPANKRKQQQSGSLATRKRAIISIASLVTLFIAYAIVSNSGRVNATLFPPPQAVVSAAIALFAEENLSIDILTSLGRVLTGYTIGVTLAILLGALMGWFWLVDAVFDPIVELIRPVPPLAYIPLMILWFGIDETPKIMVITLGCFVSCIINVVAGVKNTPLVYIEAARTMGAKSKDLFFTVAIPSALPYILTGMRVALGTAWAILVAAELIAAQRGLGFMMTNARRFIRTDSIIVGIICIGLLAFLMDRALRYVNIRLTCWMERREG
ncbi:MAG: ABC transporter permease [Chloroflexota bacterium]|jgi:ABC-type nitrate/sulfonate/bicarbonate transport system permease component